MAKVSLRSYNREIETMIDRGQFDEAIAHCRHILRTYPKHLETYRLLGKAYLESKRFGDAADIFSRILAAAPNDFVAQVGMSIIRDEENHLEDAIWHMERAFETQPSNPAIQGELQRLYARRDGVRPPRIRMTRGALANMYVQGELYPQAISEIKNVLKDDPERADMQALLARACYQSSLKNEAADVASALLRRYPYSLDANRVLAEILGAEHAENAQMYRQRVFELDPYAALVTASLFLSNEVSDAAVNVERLDWNGQPVALQPDWAESKAISPEGSEQTGWLDKSSGFGGIESAPTPIFGATPPPEEPSPFGGIESTPTSIFGSTPAAEPAPAQPAEDIPDFMRAAGWGAATGAFDESKSSVFGEEEATPSESIEQGDLPEWVKAMKPVQPATPPQQEDEEIPDWIKTIGVGAIAAKAFDQSEKKEEPIEPAGGETTGADDTTQWLTSLEDQAQEKPVEDLSGEFAWLNNLEESKASTEEPDWLKGLGTPDELSSPTQDEPDWLKGLGAAEPETSEPQEGEPDWLKGLGMAEDARPASQADEPDWLKGLGGTTPEPSEAQEGELDWIKDLGTSDVSPFTEKSDESDWLKDLGEPESTPSSREEDQPDWLKGLAFVGGVEAVSRLTKEDEPAEAKEVPSVPTPGTTESDFLDQLSEEPILEPGPETTLPAANLDQLGTSEKEQDDSFAWLEGLAAKQGATEGLLTNPEDRLEEEPEWVRQAKGLQEETPAEQSPVAAEQPASSMEDLGKSEQDQDDAFAWLESLAAKQGATEGLLTKPEDRLEEEPEWVKQAKDLSTQETPSAVSFEPEPAQPAPVDEVEDWLQKLEGQEQSSEPAADETAMWLKRLDEEEAPVSEESAEQKSAGIPDWIQNIEVGPAEEPTSIFAEEAELSSTWMPPADEPAPLVESKAEEDALPSWLSELEKEEEQIATPTDAGDLPSWLLAEETAPAVPERTIYSDWKPAEETPEEPVAEEQPAAEAPEPVSSSASPFEMAEAETVLEPEQPQAEPEPVPVMEAPVPMATSGLNIPTVDPVLGIARNELSRNNIPGALDSYGKLIRKARYLDEVIYDLREALYRYPVDVNLWQSLGDAYMRANRLQDALDAYTKAEELLR